MSFLEFIIIFLILASLLWVGLFWQRLKYDHFFKLVQKAIWKKAKFSNLEVFFAEPFLYRAIKLLSQNKPALYALCEGKYSLSEKYLQKKHKTLLAIALKAHFNPRQAILGLEKFLSLFLQSTEAKALLAALYLAQNNLAEAWAILENINLKKCSTFARGIYYYTQTHFCLQEGDLLAASQSCVKAEKYFIKSRASFLLAKTYLLLGTIYRVSFVDDVAELMFRSAGKIFDTLHLPQGKALALANLGMQNTAGEHFDVAEKYFEEAKNLLTNAQATEDMAEILNQLGLMHLLNKNFAKAIMEFKNSVNFDSAYICYLNVGCANIQYRLSNIMSAPVAETESVINFPEILKSKLYENAVFVFDEKSKFFNALDINKTNSHYLIAKLNIRETVFGFILLTRPASMPFSKDDEFLSKALASLVSYSIKDSELSNVFKLQHGLELYWMNVWMNSDGDTRLKHNDTKGYAVISGIGWRF